MTRASDLARLIGAGGTVANDVTISEGSPSIRLNDTDTSRFIDILYGTRNATFRNTMASGEDMDTVAPETIFSTKDDGETREHFRMNKSEAVFNEGSVDLDFRVESNGNANMLFVDGGNNMVGIGTNSPQNTLDISFTKDLAYSVDNFTNTANTALRIVNPSTTDNAFACMQFRCGDGADLFFGIEQKTTNAGDFVFGNQNSPDVEMMRIFSDGNVTIGKSSADNSTAGISLFGTAGMSVTRSGATVQVINRLADDGVLVSFRQASGDEGNISVSGSTISYNGFSGLHESSGIATDTPIGTVVSTIDELDVYFAKQGEGEEEEDNPKAGQTRADHAKVKVSDTEGDKAVYGVVGSFNAQGKVNVASVGIGSVRVTGACEKGDLLESNGDGTAKVQSDDIVRSKTIGKVTIGNSSTDVKLVSCVLYCG